MTLADLDPFDPDHLEDPYDLYARLREHAPLHELPGLGLRLVSRHADIKDAASRNGDFSSHLTAFVQRGEVSGSTLVEATGGAGVVVDVLATADPPDHTRQRKVVGQTFRTIESAGPMISEVADQMVGAFVAQGGGDWVDEVASRLPVRVIARLLGLPAGDLDRLKRWSDDGVELLSGVASPERMAECAASVFEFFEYLGRQLPVAAAESPDSILALLDQAVSSGGISELEARSMALQLVAAGSDSTGNLIGSAARLLAEHPGIQTELRVDRDLLPNFVEEAVRLESPFRGHFRVATRDTVLGGNRVPEGARLFLIWASANRDPNAFDDPDRIRLDRPNPRSHFGFGWGIHKCIGAPLARLEARLVLDRLLDTTTGVRPDPAALPPSHVPSLLVRRVVNVHLLTDPI